MALNMPNLNSAGGSWIIRFAELKEGGEKGELIYYVGGTDDAVRQARPVLEASSKEIVRIGAVGQASAVKIATE